MTNSATTWEQDGFECSYEEIGPGAYVAKVKDGFLQTTSVYERAFCRVQINGEIIETDAVKFDGRNDLDYLIRELRERLHSLGHAIDENPSKTLEEWAAVKPLPQFAEENLIIELLGQLLFLRDDPALGLKLWQILRAMDLYANYRIVGINALAKSGIAAQKGRSEGPKARKSKQEKIRTIIWTHTAEFWRDNPRFKGDSSNTAKCICRNANELLRAAGLLEMRDRAEKTIADDIRAGLELKFFPD